MKNTHYLTALLFGGIALCLGAQAMEFPPSLIQVGLWVWLVAPYIYISALISITTNRMTLRVILIISSILGCLGTWVFVDALYLNVDAQGGLVLLFVPVWQLAILMLTTIPIYLSRKQRET